MTPNGIENDIKSENKGPVILIIEPQKNMHSPLNTFLQAEKLSEICSVEQTDPLLNENKAHSPQNELTIIHHPTMEQRSFKKPVRLGACLEMIKSLINAQTLKIKEPIVIGHMIFHSIGKTLTQSTKPPVSLTEKEHDILVYLLSRPGEIISKKDLLERVWNYAQNVETHTLETHIYRLRQKLEKNPSAPKILITQEEGYKLVLS